MVRLIVRFVPIEETKITTEYSEWYPSTSEAVIVSGSGDVVGVGSGEAVGVGSGELVGVGSGVVVGVVVDVG